MAESGQKLGDPDAEEIAALTRIASEIAGFRAAMQLIEQHRAEAHQCVASNDFDSALSHLRTSRNLLNELWNKAENTSMPDR